MGIRQLRHLSERPADFLWLPVFVTFSTLFLMPVRLIGFLRMAHNSAWGTRRHAYAGSRSGAAELDAARAGTVAAPVPVLTRPGPDMAGAPATAAAAPAGAPRSTAAGPAGGLRPGHRRDIPPRRRRRRPNLQAAIPYLIGILIIALEVLHHA
jgi:hyaluronan synthase